MTGIVIPQTLRVIHLSIFEWLNLNRDCMNQFQQMAHFPLYLVPLIQLYAFQNETTKAYKLKTTK
jgi:hypothetical protein